METSSAADFAISMRGIVKDFGGTRALDGATLDVLRGSVHGLVGQNGAGKSTMMKIMAGLFSPTEGEIFIDGKRQGALQPSDVERLGVHFIHQDRFLVPSLTVGESLFLGRELRMGGTPLLDRRAMARRAVELLDRYFGISFPRDVLIRELTTAQRQIVQITRALLAEPSVLVFDEPTAALVRRETDTLLQTIGRLRRQGMTIIYISHYLKEIEQVCDAVTIMRNGRDVETVDPRLVTPDQIASRMVARDVGALFPQRTERPGDTLLEIENLTLPGKLENIGLSLREGEIVGLTGLIGSGVKNLVNVLYGIETGSTGRITVAGKPLARERPATSVLAGLGLVPEDRRNAGIVLDMSVVENITLASLPRYVRRGLLDNGAERADAEKLVSDLAVKARSTDTNLRHLSGGNQQKVSLAKWLNARSRIYVLDEPTVGVDVGAKVEIYKLIAKLAEEGAAVLVVSTDLDELVGLCDRVVVLFRGRVAGEYRGDSFDSDDLLAASSGASKVTAHAV